MNRESTANGHREPILVSACLLGQPVGYDGSSWPSDLVGRIAADPRITAHPFCPEAHTLGVPRRWMTIHDGDGFAVLDRRARVINVDGEDLSDAEMDEVYDEQAKVQDAIDAANDCVFAFAGTYEENISFNGKDIEVTGVEGWEATVIEGTGDGDAILLMAHYDTVPTTPLSRLLIAPCSTMKPAFSALRLNCSSASKFSMFLKGLQ